MDLTFTSAQVLPGPDIAPPADDYRIVVLLIEDRRLDGERRLINEAASDEFYYTDTFAIAEYHPSAAPTFLPARAWHHSSTRVER